MLNHFYELTDHSCVGSVMCPECPTKDGRGLFCWLNTEKQPRGRPRPSWNNDYISDVACPVLLGCQQNYLKLEIAVDREVFQVLLLPSDLPRGKADTKMIEMNSICLI